MARLEWQGYGGPSKNVSSLYLLSDGCRLHVLLQKLLYFYIHKLLYFYMHFRVVGIFVYRKSWYNVLKQHFFLLQLFYIEMNSVMFDWVRKGKFSVSFNLMSCFTINKIRIRMEIHIYNLRKVVSMILQ